MSLINKLGKKMDEAVADDLACDIVMRHITGANGLVAVISVHQILQKMRNGKYTEEYEIGYCNLTMRRQEDNVVINIPNKDGLTHKTRRYNIFTYHLDKKFGLG